MTSINKAHPPCALKTVNLGNTYGALLIGVIVSAVCYGILISQTASYFRVYPKDPIGVKVMVALLLIFETVTVVLETYALYDSLVINFGNAAKLVVRPWSLKVESAIVYTIMLISQGFFAIRIWRLSRGSWFFASSVLLIALAAYGTALTIIVMLFHLRGWDHHAFKIVAPANKVLEAVVDVLITVGLCFYLRQSRSAIRKTNSMIDRLILFFLHRGALITFLQLGYLIAYEINAQYMSWLALHVIVSKVYSITVLATLNNRCAIRKIGDTSAEPTQAIYLTSTTPHDHNCPNSIVQKLQASASESTIPTSHQATHSGAEMG